MTSRQMSYGICYCEIKPMAIVDCDWVGDSLVCFGCGQVIIKRVAPVSKWRLKLADMIDGFRRWMWGGK